jgi:hypothetical protein
MVYVRVLKMAAMSMSLLQGLRLVNSKVCLLLPHQINPRPSTPLPDRINQQDIGDITQSTSMESAPAGFLN